MIRAFAMAVLSIFLLAAADSAEAGITLTPAQEQQVGTWQIRDAGAAYLEECPALASIQDNIIFMNRDRLRPFRKKGLRGLRPPHLLYTHNSRVSAYYMPGGHIFVSDAMVTAFLSKDFDPYTGETSGKQKRDELGNSCELYGHSALAAALAHEASHWERNFLQQETAVITAHITAAQEEMLRRSLEVGAGRSYSSKLEALGLSPEVLPEVKEFIRREELAADEGAMELLDNTADYSPGSLMMVASRLKDPVEGEKISHSSAAQRNQQVREHISRLSQGRVQLDEAGHLSLDGELFMGRGYLPARIDVSAYDRTVYVAGQLAKSVCYNDRQLKPLDDEQTISSSGNMIPLMAVCDDDSRRRFIIDKFAISKARASAVAAGQEAGDDPEGKAAKEIADFLKK